LLEAHHGYIQWIFPIREEGLNSDSQPLQLHEVEKMKADPECIKRYLKSYDMMLHFYGCKMKDRQTGEIERHEEWQKYYKNLSSHFHNNLRITRMLKSLGEFGFEHYKKPFLEHFIKEICETKILSSCADSCSGYWLGTIKDDATRASLEKKVRSLKTSIADADSDSDDAVEQSWTSSRPSGHAFDDAHADNAGSDDDDDARATASKIPARESMDESNRPTTTSTTATATTKTIRKEKQTKKKSKDKFKEKEEEERHSGSGGNHFFISKPGEFTARDEKKYVQWMGGGPNSDDDTEEGDLDELLTEIGENDKLDPEQKEKYQKWVAETLGANSDEEYTNPYLDGDDDDD